MAKRSRGSRSSHRPGGQGPSRARRSLTPGSSGAAPVPAGTGPDIDEAIEAVGAEYTELSLEESAPAPTPVRPRRARRSARAQAESLEGRAAAENIWVREDLRRIGMITAVLLAGLVVAWIVFVFADVLSLY